MVKILRLIEKNRKFIVILFFSIFFLVGVLIYKDYGLSWDEEAYREIGQTSYNYVTKNDVSLFSYRYRGFPVIIELPLIFIEKTFGLKDTREIFFIRHLCNFIIFYLSLIFFYFLCCKIFKNWKISLLGVLFLILSPRIFAEAFYNSRDLTCLSFFIIAMYFCLIFFEKKNYLNAIYFAIATAIAINVRILGIFIPLFIFILMIVDWRNIKATFKYYLSYIIVLIFLTIILWPFLWHNTLSHIKDILLLINQDREMTVLYLGKYILSNNLPWHYIPLWITITTPVLYLGLFIIGLFYTFKSLAKNQIHILLLMWFFLPIIFMIILNNYLIDGWRYLFFVYPAFLLIGLIGLENLLKITNKFRIIIYLLILTSIIITFQFMIKNHPYQNVYFNFLAGKNMASVKNNFEIDYWGLSYRKGLEYILKNDSNSTIPINVANMPGIYNKDILTSQERDRLKYVDLEDAKYFLTNFRWHKENYQYEEFYSIKVDNVAIMTVYKLK